MEDFEFEFDTDGAPVIYSNAPPEPHNPLNRPEISYKKMLIALSLFVVSTAAVYIAVEMIFGKYGIWAALVWAFVYLCVIAKRAIIWMVHLYQNKASDEIRLKCVYEPSCSEYMILAIEKYGTVRGVIKGCGRLLRCGPPGGIDYP